MVIAACEVVIGLGIIVAMYRNRLPIDVDEMSELARMSATTYGWLILAFPLAGAARDLARLARAARPHCRAGSPARAMALLVPLLDRRGCRAARPRAEDARALVDTAWTYAATGGTSGHLAILVDPLSIFMCLVVSGVSFLIHLYSVAYMVGRPRATRASSPTSTSSSSRCCCWSWPRTSCC